MREAREKQRKNTPAICDVSEVANIDLVRTKNEKKRNTIRNHCPCSHPRLRPLARVAFFDSGHPRWTNQRAPHRRSLDFSLTCPHVQSTHATRTFSIRTVHRNNYDRVKRRDRVLGSNIGGPRARRGPLSLFFPLLCSTSSYL